MSTSPLARRAASLAMTALAVLGIVAATLVGLDDTADNLAAVESRSSIGGAL